MKLDTLTLPEKVRLRRLLWEEMRRPEQALPEGVWQACWISGGRGSGKTRAGAEGAAELVYQYPNVNGAIVAPTFQADALRKCVEGKSGILRAIAGLVDNYNRSEGVIYLTTGATIFATGADNGALRIQGENLGWAWCDEIGLWRRHTWQTAWEESIQFAVREAPSKVIATGTPKAGHPLVRILSDDDGVPKRRMSTKDNIANLNPEWVKQIMSKYEGTRLGAQELEGLLIGEVEGALWTWVWIEKLRIDKAPDLTKVVVAVDPSGGTDEIGIVVAGKMPSPCPCGTQDEKGPHFAVVDDRTLVGSPERWGRAAVGAYHDWQASRLVAERNFGGDMVESTIRTADRTVPVKVITASRGKAQRAEPVSAVYEQGRVHHVGVFPELETELTSWVPGDDWSPNRLDACLAGWTPVLTDKGEVPIADVQPGDRVWTSKGWRSVEAHRLTDVRPTVTVELSNGQTLTGTGDHRVATETGWARLDALVLGVRLVGWNESRTTASPTPATRTPNSERTGSTSRHHQSPDSLTSIGRFTSTITGRSRTTGTSTTSTAIPSTTTRQTLSPSHHQTMPASIPALTGSTPNGSPTLKPSVPWPPSGIVPKRAGRGTKSMDAEHGRGGNQPKASAKNVGDRWKSGLIGSGSVPGRASTGPTPSATTSPSLVRSAVPTSCNGTADPKPVPVHVVGSYRSSALPVYDLQVADAREFLAAGVIVHNCVWAMSELGLESGSGGMLRDRTVRSL